MKTSYKSLIFSLVLGLFVGLSTLVPTTVATSEEELSVVGGACDCSGTDTYECPGCTAYTYTRCYSEPPDYGTCEKTGDDCTAAHCDATMESCRCVF